MRTVDGRQAHCVPRQLAASPSTRGAVGSVEEPLVQVRGEVALRCWKGYAKQRVGFGLWN